MTTTFSAVTQIHLFVSIFFDSCLASIDEYLIIIRSLIGDELKIEGAIISSVVPALTLNITNAIKKLYGIDNPINERYWLMLKNYLCFDFGESYYRQIGVLDLIKEKLPVSISLGLFSTLLIYLLGIPLGIYKAKNDGARLDVVSSLVIVVANAIPAFLFGIILIVLFAGGNYWDIFPLRGLVSDDFENLSFFGRVKDYLWHIALPVFLFAPRKFRRRPATACSDMNLCRSTGCKGKRSTQ